MSNMLKFLLIILFLFFYNTVTVIFSKKKFGTCLPVSLICMTLLMFFSQLIFKTFNIGFYINIIISIIGIPLLIGKLIYYKLRKDNKSIELLKDVFSAGFWSFIIIFAILAIINYGRHLSTWDEMSHWGEMVKEMFRLDKFYTVNTSTLMFHKDYPPFISLFELLCCKIYGNFSESIITIAIQFFSLSLITPALFDNEKFKNKFIINGLLNIAVIIMIIAFDTDNVFPTIYSDFFMAFLFVNSMILVFTNNVRESKFGYICLLLNFVALLLTKQMGIALFMMTIVYYVAKSLLDKNINKKNIIKESGLILILLIIPLLSLKVWNNYVNKFDLEKQFVLSDISFNEMNKMIHNYPGYEVRYTGYKNYINAIFSRTIYSNIIKITFVSSIFLIIALILILQKIYKKQFEKKQAILLSIIMTIGAVGYAFTMLVLYLFSFDDGQCVDLNSFNRYMSTYIVSEILILFILFIKLEIKKQKELSTNEKTNAGIILLVALLSIGLFKGGNLSFFLPQEFKTDKTKDIREIANYINSKTEENSKIFLISDGFGQNQIFLHYFSNPRVFYKEYDLINSEYSDKMLSDVKNQISKNDYVYVMRTNENFSKNYKSIFKNQITEKSLYKVEYYDGELNLVLVQ